MNKLVGVLFMLIAFLSVSQVLISGFFYQILFLTICICATLGLFILFKQIEKGVVKKNE